MTHFILADEKTTTPIEGTFFPLRATREVLQQTICSPRSPACDNMVNLSQIGIFEGDPLFCDLLPN